uniref:Uncharacterized protein n=1 Tax=Meloidogyne floridensis TaxID=298350 RepID=A0A915NT40_9BILA
LRRGGSSGNAESIENEEEERHKLREKRSDGSNNKHKNAWRFVASKSMIPLSRTFLNDANNFEKNVAS